MARYSFLKSSCLKIALIGIFSFLIALGITTLIVNDVIGKQPDSIQQSIADKFNKVKIEIEFNGITDKVRRMTENYTDLFDGYSNIIITDDKGDIVYNVNSGYISEKNKFLVLVDPESRDYDSDMAYLIDSKNNIKYSAHLDIYVNSNRLKGESAANPLVKTLYPKDLNDNTGGNEITDEGPDTKVILNYEYVASKGLNLYSVYDSEHQFNNYYLLTDSLRTVMHWLLISAALLLLLFWILLPLWVFRNAKRKNLNAALWAIIVFITNIAGLGLYLILKPGLINCRSCNRHLEKDWLLCPYCGEKTDSVKSEKQNKL